MTFFSLYAKGGNIYENSIDGMGGDNAHCLEGRVVNALKNTAESNII